MRYDYESAKFRVSGLPVSRRMKGVWRYSPLLPITSMTKPVTLGEGNTPFQLAEKVAEILRMKNLFVKDESRNPTLSFKDRKSTVAISKALEFGTNGVTSITAGNAGASVAAYAAKAGIKAYIFTMAGISDAKLAKLVSYGAKVFRTRAHTKVIQKFVGEVCQEYGFLNLTAASRYNPYIKEGAKTAIFEIFEEMKGQLPEWIVIPVGGGGNLASYFKGIRELRELKLIDNYPRLVGVQGENCAPVVEAFERKLDPRDIPTIPNPSTIGHSILDDWAPDGDQALMAIRETKGTAMGVSDGEMLEAMKLLSSREGIFVEPAAAAPLAGLRKLLENRTIDSSDTVVIVATGSGSNQPDTTLQAWGTPPTIETDLSSFSKYLKN